MNWLNINEFDEIAFEKANVGFKKEGVQKAFDFLTDFSTDKIIYGINTGFGPMAQFRIADEKLKQLQYNLIRSHATGSGMALPELHCRAISLARLTSLAQGKSGVSVELLELLEALLNKDIIPVIYEHGGVGASGDLVQLAHLALACIAEGEVYYKGEISEAKEVFEKEDLKPIEIYVREGLGILNGTSGMTGTGLVNLHYAKKQLNWSILFSSMINELVETFDDHFSAQLNDVKHHVGQTDVAAKMRAILKDSKNILRREDVLYKSHKDTFFEKKIQEYYSLRCVPQILGPVAETLYQTEKLLEEELNSVNDNPIIDAESESIYHGGNFHGDYVSLEMDKLKIVIAKLSMLAERQINFLVNPSLNKILPPFVNKGELGLNLGLQGTIFTATSTTAENQSLSYPNYLHSIPNNNDNMDIVSMGANSAQLAMKVVENTFEILAIEAMCIIQAIDILGIQDKLSSTTRKYFNELNEIAPTFVEDKPQFKNIRAVKNYLKTHKVEISS